MGWKEAEERARLAQEEDKASLESFMESDLSFGSSKGLNAQALFGEVTGEDKMPDVEPEATWISDLDRMPLKAEALRSLMTKSFNNMSKFSKFKGKDDNWKANYLYSKLIQFRPTIMSTLGAS